MVDFEPPLIACIVSSGDNSSGRDIDKFAKFGLTPVKASHVGAPLIAECCINLECKVRDTRLVDAYGLFILEVVKAWADPKQKDAKTIHHRGYGKFVVDGKIVRLKSKMR
jgi:flavin reductase (DIM6/NTAB) family NADH-FMN oxidoreductase RutF